MIPYKYKKCTDLNNDATFHYHYKQLKDFLIQGFKEGNNGWILVSRKGNIDTFRGFGTIENPCKKLLTISIVHNPLWDGERKTLEEIIHPKIPKAYIETYRMILLDFSNLKEE